MATNKNKQVLHSLWLCGLFFLAFLNSACCVGTRNKKPEPATANGATQILFSGADKDIYRVGDKIRMTMEVQRHIPKQVYTCRHGEEIETEVDLPIQEPYSVCSRPVIHLHDEDIFIGYVQATEDTLWIRSFSSISPNSYDFEVLSKIFDIAVFFDTTSCDFPVPFFDEQRNIVHYGAEITFKQSGTYVFKITESSRIDISKNPVIATGLVTVNSCGKQEIRDKCNLRYLSVPMFKKEFVVED